MLLSCVCQKLWKTNMGQVLEYESEKMAFKVLYNEMHASLPPRSELNEILNR